MTKLPAPPIIGPRLTPDQERQRMTWQYRAILHTRSNFTLLGCIILAMNHKLPRTTPRISTQIGCIITEGGMVVADMQLDQHLPFKATALGSPTEIRDALRRMCDEIKLDDKDREAVFLTFRQWIHKDYTAVSGIPVTKLH